MRVFLMSALLSTLACAWPSNIQLTDRDVVVPPHDLPISGHVICNPPEVQPTPLIDMLSLMTEFFDSHMFQTDDSQWNLTVDAGKPSGGSCVQAQRYGNSAIWVCNDNNARLSVEFHNILTFAFYIIGSCRNDNKPVKGQAISKHGWNVIIGNIQHA